MWPLIIILGCLTFAATYSIGIRHEPILRQKYRGKHNIKKVFK